MIPDGVPILPGLRVRHDEGLLYRVDDTIESTNGYETSHQLGSMSVNYTQLEDGIFPAGKRWAKDEPGFRTYFTVEETAAAQTGSADSGELLPVGEILPYKNDAMSVLAEFLDVVDQPSPEDMKKAKSVIKASHYHYGGSDGMMGTCFALVRGTLEPTTIISALFSTDDPVLLDSWRESPVFARKVATLTAQIESGLLEAINTDFAMSGVSYSEVADHLQANRARINVLSKLVNDLQEK